MLSTLSFLVLQSTPLTALGISTIILGAVTFAIDKGQPKIPPEASAILLQSGLENISAIVEELGLKAKAIYLPKSITKEKTKALIPLGTNTKINTQTLPKRLIVKYDNTPQSMGLLITTPGSAVASQIETKTAYSASDIESSISQVLSGTVNLADGARVKIEEDKITVEVINPRLQDNKMWIYESIGTPITSIVASVVAEVTDKPITITSEQYGKGKIFVELKVLERSM